MQMGPPQITPPGLSSIAMAGAGAAVGQAPYGQSYSAASMYGDVGQTMAGARAADFVGNTMVPMAVHGGMAASMIAAPIMAQGSAGALGTMAGHAMMRADPFYYVGHGARFGWSAGRGGQAMAALRGATTLGGATRAGLGVGRGLMYGAAGAALPVAVGLAATEAVIAGGKQMFKGAEESMVGAALMKNMGGQFGGGIDDGTNVGRLMSQTGQDIGKGVGEMADMVRDMDRMKMFQTTRSVKEFKERFTEIMSTVKEVAQTMQTSVDDALKMVGEMRQQGFYTTSDIKAGTLRQNALQGASGLSQGQMVQAGRFGSQYARALGMRGRFGAQFAQQQTAGVAMALRSGAMSEEDVMERGGVEAVGANLAATQMRFLRSSRGRVMIANMYGGGGEMNMDRANRFLSGDQSLESMVTGAANRGLGVLRASGGREARENAMQYAGMGMVSMAAAQSKQLYGGYNKRGIISMLGTMGVGRTDANLLLQQTMAMPDVLEAQYSEEYDQSQVATAEEQRRRHSIGARVSGYLHSEDRQGMRGIFTSARRAGQQVYKRGRRGYQAGARLFGQEITSTGGGEADLEMANRYAARLASGSADAGEFDADFEGTSYFDVVNTGRVLGRAGTREQIRNEYSGYTGDIRGLSREQRESGEYMNLGGNKFISRSAYNQARRVQAEAGEMTSQQSSTLRSRLFQGGDAVDQAESVLRGAGQGDTLGMLRSTGGSLSREETNALKLAMATDVLTGQAGDKRGLTSGLEGDKLIAAYTSDEDFRMRMMERMRKVEGSSDYVGASDLRGSGLGTAQGERERFSKSMDDRLDSLGIGNIKLGLFGEVNTSGGNELREKLRDDEKTRAAMTKYIKAMQSGDTEAINQAVSGFGELGDAGEMLTKMARQADGDSGFAAQLRGSTGAGLLEDIERLAYSEQRGRAYSRFAGSAGAYEGGGPLGDRIRRLSTVGDMEGYSKEISGITKDILAGGIEADKGERALLEQVFGRSGSRMADAFTTLTGSDREAAAAQAKKLGIDAGAIEGGSEAERITKTIEALAEKGLLDPAAFSATSGTDVGDSRTAVTQANTRFVAAVDRFVTNLRSKLDDVEPIDLPDPPGAPG